MLLGNYLLNGVQKWLSCIFCKLSEKEFCFNVKQQFIYPSIQQNVKFDEIEFQLHIFYKFVLFFFRVSPVWNLKT